MVARAGAGPDPIPHKQLSSDNLAHAINFCLKPESLERASELASKISKERGSDMGAQSFHQYLEPDRLRCTLAPSRAAVWRIKRTQIRLSAFAACTLANANLLDFQDLKLFRAQEHYTDEGPRDPISGGFTTACRAFYTMGLGIVEFPGETYKALQMPFGPSRQQSQASLPTTATEASRGQLRRANSGASKSEDMLRQSGAHTSRGAGRALKALVSSPMELSVSLTKGLHNVPKLWGDDTVRPQERVSDFKTGMQALGREFGYGYYDAIAGLATHPWKGAQKEGATGFFKGLGKGFGGFFPKLAAAHFGILSHTLKGVHREVQNMFGSNVQNYIVTSRVGQGYEEWLQSNDAEKQDVINGWTAIQKYLKKKVGTEEMVKDVMEAQRRQTTE
jgi:hypothetical protein